jgi:ABC-2 type transport system permease protein
VPGARYFWSPAALFTSSALPTMSLFLRQFSAELHKMFARKRTWMGFAAFFALEVVLLILFRTKGATFLIQRDFDRNAGGLGLMFEDYFRGLTMAFMIMAWTVVLLGSIYLALVAGDVVSKEVEDGTMRMTLCRPVSRFRVLLVKYLACVVYTITLVVFIGGTALLTGIAWKGLGGLFAFVPEEKLLILFPQSEGLVRYALSLVLFSGSLLTITTLAFLFSCFNAKPAAATVMTMTIFLSDRILSFIPAFENYRHWLMSTHMTTWTNAFRESIPWERVVSDYLYLFGLNGTFLMLGFAVFARRDFKS